MISYVARSCCESNDLLCMHAPWFSDVCCAQLSVVMIQSHKTEMRLVVHIMDEYTSAAMVRSGIAKTIRR